jgi:hypothetical protein
MERRAKPVKRRNHTVNKSYLKRFANADGHLIQVTLPGTKRTGVSITDATVHRNFYVVTLPDGSQADFAEDVFGLVEAAATEAIRSLVERHVWPIPDQVRLNIARWIALQYFRVPWVRNLGREITQAFAGDGLPVRTKTGESVVVRMPADEPPDLTSIQLRLIARNVSEVGRMLCWRGWTLTFYERKPLATSDTPVIALGPQTSSGVIGIANAAEIHVPLDRRVALSIAEPGGSDRRLQGSAKTARLLNELTVTNARRFLFHHPDDDPLSGIDLPEPRTRELSGSEAARVLIENVYDEVILDAADDAE